MQYGHVLSPPRKLLHVPICNNTVTFKKEYTTRVADVSLIAYKYEHQLLNRPHSQLTYQGY